MNTSDWISRKVSKLLPTSGAKRQGATRDAGADSVEPKVAEATDAMHGLVESKRTEVGGAGSSPAARGQVASRSTGERLVGTLRRKGEAMSPRALRHALAEGTA